MRALVVAAAVVAGCGPDRAIEDTQSRIEESCAEWCEIQPRCYGPYPNGGTQESCIENDCKAVFFRFAECTDVALTSIECHAALTCEEYDAMFDLPTEQEPCGEQEEALVRCNYEHSQG
jgi:hypothetical protein